MSEHSPKPPVPLEAQTAETAQQLMSPAERAQTEAILTAQNLADIPTPTAQEVAAKPGFRSTPLERRLTLEREKNAASEALAADRRLLSTQAHEDALVTHSDEYTDALQKLWTEGSATPLTDEALQLDVNAFMEQHKDLKPGAAKMLRQNFLEARRNALEKERRDAVAAARQQVADVQGKVKAQADKTRAKYEAGELLKDGERSLADVRAREEKEAKVAAFQAHIGAGKAAKVETNDSVRVKMPDHFQSKRPDSIPYKQWLSMNHQQRAEAAEAEHERIVQQVLDGDPSNSGPEPQEPQHPEDNEPENPQRPEPNNPDDGEQNPAPNPPQSPPPPRSPQPTPAPTPPPAPRRTPEQQFADNSFDLSNDLIHSFNTFNAEDLGKYVDMIRDPRGGLATKMVPEDMLYVCRSLDHHLAEAVDRRNQMIANMKARNPGISKKEIEQRIADSRDYTHTLAMLKLNLDNTVRTVRMQHPQLAARVDRQFEDSLDTFLSDEERKEARKHRARIYNAAFGTELPKDAKPVEPAAERLAKAFINEALSRRRGIIVRDQYNYLRDKARQNKLVKDLADYPQALRLLHNSGVLRGKAAETAEKRINQLAGRQMRSDLRNLDDMLARGEAPEPDVIDERQRRIDAQRQAQIDSANAEVRRRAALTPEQRAQEDANLRAAQNYLAGPRGSMTSGGLTDRLTRSAQDSAIMKQIGRDPRALRYLLGQPGVSSAMKKRVGKQLRYLEGEGIR